MIKMNNDVEENEIDDLYEHYSIKVAPSQSLLRIDKFLTHFIPNTSRTKLHNAISAQNIKVNKKIVKPNYRVKPDDLVQVILDYPRPNLEIIPQDIALDIVYEDDYLAVINKKPGMVVHPGFGNRDGTLVNALAYRWNDLPSIDKNGENIRPGLVHRIDKDTSGLILVAKSEKTLFGLAQQFFDKTVHRKYHAICWGNIEEDERAIEGYIGRDKKDRKLMALHEEEFVGGKWSKTNCKVIKRYNYLTYLECKLETGRTHQIRAHLKSLRNPLFSDEKYGGDKVLYGNHTGSFKHHIASCFNALSRQALHAKTLGFYHPDLKKELFFDSELPEDVKLFLEKINSYV